MTLAEKRKYKLESKIWKLISPLEHTASYYFNVATAKLWAQTGRWSWLPYTDINFSLIKLSLVFTYPVIPLAKCSVL